MEPIVVDNPAEFLAWLQANTEGPYGLDLETKNVDPTEESPVGRGEPVFWTLAWVDSSLGLHAEHGTPRARAAFLERPALEQFRAFLESERFTGHNIVSFDRHVLLNVGVDVRNIVADTLRMAKLLDPSSTENGLKPWLKRAFGYETHDYADLFSRRKPGAIDDLGEVRSTWRKLGDEQRVPTIVGGAASRVGVARDLIPLDALGRDYPHLMPTMRKYACLDASGALELYFLLRRRLERTPWRGLGQTAPWGTMWDFYEKFWHPSLYDLNKIERNGISYDANIAVAGRTAAEIERARHEAEAYAWVGREVNLHSSAQLSEVIYGEKFYPIPAVTGTLKAIKGNREQKPTTSEAALHSLLPESSAQDRAGLQHVLSERKLTDLIQFLDKLPAFRDADNRIHTILRPDTRTGRLSSSKPALQQIPKDDTYGLRSAFVAPPGHKLIVADYGALEPRVQAHFLVTLFRDTSLLDAINFGDVYCGVAKECWPEFRGWSLAAIKADPKRAEAKIVLLAKAYGKSLTGMALQLGKSINETKDIVNRIDAAFPGVPRFQRHMAEYAREHGGVHTLLGRFRPLTDIYSKDRGLRAAAERQAYNSPIQGSATDIMTAARGKLSSLVKIVLEVHDELIVEAAASDAQATLDTVVANMVHPLKAGLLKVPLVVEAHVGDSWAEAKQ